MSDEKPVAVERKKGGVAVITLNNPPLNLQTLELMGQLEKAVMELNDDDMVRVVILTGTGSRAFSAGSDIKEFPQLSDNFVEKKLRRENAVFNRIEGMQKPVIAAINGAALGGGCELALTCDFRIMDEKAQIGLPEIMLGTSPGSGALSRLPKLVGVSRAMQLMWSGTALSAQQARAIGLINRIAPEGQVLETAYAMAYELSMQAAFAIRCIKHAVQAAPFQTSAEAVEMSLRLSEEIFKTEDSAEGPRAFLEKRRPHFKGAPVDNC